MIKKIDKIFIKYICYAATFLVIGIIGLCVATIYYTSSYIDFFVNKNDPFKFWIGFLLISILIISCATIVATSALIFKLTFSIYMEHYSAVKKTPVKVKKELKNKRRGKNNV